MFDEVNGGFGSAPKFPHPAALDLVMDRYVRTGNDHTSNDKLRTVFVTTLEKMARGGVYDQLAGGFHRYSVDERWIVPHFEKMCYDNSELLKNYVHAYQATGDEFFAGVARDIIRWMDEWLSDRARGGFYASQDADYSMDDDGDYFTWTLEEAKAALTEDEAAVAVLYYDIQEVGDMHHNPAKNVLYIRSSLEEIVRRLNIQEERAGALLAAAQKKMYAARLLRPTPYVDKTVYAGWNAMCVSAYLKAAKVLDLGHARSFALRSLDRLLSEGWTAERGMKHVIAYSDPRAEQKEVGGAVPVHIPGVLDDYAFAVIACLDAYEATADLSYFRFARSIGDAMVAGFFDPVAGGFFDTRAAAGRGRRSRCCVCMAMPAMFRITWRRIATRLSRLWRSTLGSRDSMGFLRRLTGWRWCTSSSRTNKSWSSGGMQWPRSCIGLRCGRFALGQRFCVWTPIRLLRRTCRRL